MIRNRLGGGKCASARVLKVLAIIHWQACSHWLSIENCLAKVRQLANKAKFYKDQSRCQRVVEACFRWAELTSKLLVAIHRKVFTSSPLNRVWSSRRYFANVWENNRCLLSNQLSESLFIRWNRMDVRHGSVCSGEQREIFCLKMTFVWFPPRLAALLPILHRLASAILQSYCI